MLCCEAPALIVVTAEAALLAGLLSTSEVVTLALLVIAPAFVAVATIVSVAEPSDGIVPRLPVTRLPVCPAVPWLGVAETYARPLGNRSVTTVLAATPGPPLVTV